MKLQYSAEGAYDEVVEASAERILFVARDRNASSGYSSDTDSSNLQELETCSVDSGDSSSSSGYSTSNTLDNEQCGIESDIEFLQEKQSLLKRAICAMKREGAYEASRARQIVDGQFERKVSSLWVEAKEIVDILNNRDGNEIPIRVEKRHASEEIVVETPIKPFKSSRIDVSSVICVSSGSSSGDTIIGQTSLTLQKEATSKIPFLVNGPWMGKALAGSGPSSMCGWEVVHDPNLGLLVVPPSLQKLQNGVELRDALALTSHAQLVTLSAPPFWVVHANKAFCIFSGLSSEDIIGKPVESLLQLDEDEDTRNLSLTASRALHNSFSVSAKPCQLEVMPVTDTFRNPSGGMSHLLVKVQARDTVDAGAGNYIHGSSLLSKDLSVHGHHQVFGAVG